ncbi:MAG TPA: type II toxin-antitoxin system HicB family antitoxin [Candidatus Acidoferrales bacterium]|nr:type II toxin-antitoxin system HicB family antitoxin [Candidatus Acidoferrales bacterium]
MEREYTAVIEKHGRWYVAFVEEIPGVNTQGRTLKEARRNLKEALAMILAANRSIARRQSSRSARRELISVRA